MKKLLKPKSFVAALAILSFGTLAGTPAQALKISDIPGAVLGVSTSSAFPYPSGSLVKDGGTIYFINGTVKVPFANYKAFTGLGYSLRNVVSGDLSNYTLAQSYVISTANSAHPWGAWLSYKNTIYYSSQDGLIGVPSAEVFVSNGGQWKFVVKANKYDITALNSNSHLPALTDGDARVTISPANQFANSPAPAANTASGTNAGVPPANAAASGPGSLNPPTLSAASPASQFVFGNTTNQTAAAFHFSASGSPVTITELDVASVYSSSLPFPPISTVIIAGISSPLVVNTSTVTGLNLVVPASGIDVPVGVNYQPVGPNSIPAGQTFTVNLVGIKYATNGTTTTMAVNLPSNSMNLVASAPTVSLAGGGQALTDNTILVAKVTVTGNAGGNLTINRIPLTFTAKGGATVIATTSNMTVTDDANGSPIPVNYGNGVGVATGSSASLTIIFNGDNVLNGGASKTYDFYLPVQGALGDPGTSAITTKLGDPASFLFTDTVGGGSNIPVANNGITYVPGYPTTGVSAHN